jgi:hypothetical protein
MVAEFQLLACMPAKAVAGHFALNFNRYQGEKDETD